MSKSIKLFNYKGIDVIFMPDEMNIWLKSPDGVSSRSINDYELRDAPQEAWYTNDKGVKIPNLWHGFYRNQIHPKFGGSLWSDILIFAMEYEDRNLIDDEGFIKLDEAFKMKFVDGGGDIFAVNKLIIYKDGQEVAKWTTDECFIKRLIPVIKRSRLYKELCEKYS